MSVLGVLRARLVVSPSNLRSPLGSKWVRSNEDVALLLLDPWRLAFWDKALSRSEKALVKQGFACSS